MKTFTSIIIILVLWIGIPPLTRELPAQDRGTGDLDGESYLTLKKDIEIMQRVLEKALSKNIDQYEETGRRAFNPVKPPEELVDESLDQTDYTAYSYTGTLAGSLTGAFTVYRFNTKGFFVPGSGAVFSLDVVVPARSEPLEEDEEGGPDLWKEAEEELRLGHSLKSGKKVEMKRWVIDDKAVDGTIDMLITTVAHHGGKIEHLGGEDYITLIVHFKGQSRYGRAASFGGDTALALSTLYYQAAKDALLEDVIIQIPISVLNHYDQTGEVDQVKDATRIHRFINKKAKGDQKPLRKKSF